LHQQLIAQRCEVTLNAGWVDPILAEGAGSAASPAAKMSLTYAFETRNSPMEIYQKNLTDLSYNTSALFFWRNVTSGRDQGDVPQQVCIPAALTDRPHTYRPCFRYQLQCRLAE